MSTIMDRAQGRGEAVPLGCDEEGYLDFVEGVRLFYLQTVTPVVQELAGPILDASLQTTEIDELVATAGTMPIVQLRDRLARTSQEMMFRGAMEGYRHRRGELLADIAASEHRGPGDLSFELGSPPDYMFISHDMRTMAHIADRVAVMYLGQIVEIGPARDVTLSPQHPYTNGLIASLPELHPRPGSRRKPAGGEVPNPASPPPGCRYHPRCPLAVQRCRLEAPLLERKSDGRWVACHMVPQ